MSKVLWLSQHQPIGVQIKALQALYGSDVKIHQDPKPFSSADDIVRRFRGQFDDMVIVAPLFVIQKITEQNIRPLWADMKEVVGDVESHVQFKGRRYAFQGFKRIIGVTIQFEEGEVKPCSHRP